MWFALRMVSVGLGLLSVASCCDDPPEPEECTLPEEPQFEVTSTVLQVNASHAECPTDVPAGLGSDEIESQGLCEQEIVDCTINLDCDVNGITVVGQLGELDGTLVGRVEMTKPIKCVYEVTGRFK
jgi:hypothetical protein